MDRLLELLQWAIPGGLGIWQIVLIFSYKRLNKAKVVRDTRDVWQEIADSNNEALQRQNDEIIQLRDTVARLERMVHKAIGCRYYELCPIRGELPKYKNDSRQRIKQRQYAADREGERLPRDGTGEPDDYSADDGRPP